MAGPASRAQSTVVRIAQVAPLYESVPPKFYGGTERVVHYLTEELVRAGHNVTLFASGDSVTSAELDAAWPRALRLDPECRDYQAPHVLQLERIAQRAHEFDVIHFHGDCSHFPLSRRLGTPHVTTLHGRLDAPQLEALYDEFDDLPMVSISNAQRRPLPQVAWCGTVYHGLPLSLHSPSFSGPNGRGTYFAFLGRISPEKRVDRAIEIAKRLGVKLKIAAKIDCADAEYYRNEIAPLLDHPLIEFVGEIGEAQKSEFLGGARALLFPIDWPEPFGLVMIEAMACGTPVVAMGCGSVPEIIDQGVTGYYVNDLDAAVKAAERAMGLDRRLCRATFERRFSAPRMASDYLAVYVRVIDRARRRGPSRARTLVAAE